jgi:serine/threonine protein kinase
MSFSVTAASAAAAPIEIQQPEFLFEKLDLLGFGDTAKVFILKDSKGTLFAGKCFHLKEDIKDKFPKEYLDHIFDADGKNILAKREFEMASKLQPCESILKIFDHIYPTNKEGVVESWLIMELVDGVELNQFKGVFTYQNFIKNTLHLISALRHAYTLKIVSTDLHSSNIMIDSHGNLKLIDCASFDEIQDEKGLDLENKRFVNDVLFVIDSFAIQTHPSAELSAMKDRISACSENRPGKDKIFTSASVHEFIIPWLCELEAVIKS